MAVNLSPVGGVAGQFFDNNGNPLSGGKIFTYSAGTTTNQPTYTSASGGIAHTNPIILDSAGRVPSGEIWLTDGLAYKFVITDSNDVLIGTYDNIIGINSNFVNFTNEQEIQTATAGQTVFNLTTMQYQPGTNSLSVFVDGVNQYGPGAQFAYVETDSDTVTFVSGLHVGASVKFTTSQLNSSGAVDAAQVSYDPPFVGSVFTNVEDKLAQTVSVKDFGAVGDGITNDTTAFTNAISAAAGAIIYVPEGTYRISSVTGTSAYFCGSSAEKSVIELAATGTESIFQVDELRLENLGFSDRGRVGMNHTSNPNVFLFVCTDAFRADNCVFLTDRNVLSQTPTANAKWTIVTQSTVARVNPPIVSEEESLDIFAILTGVPYIYFDGVAFNELVARSAINATYLQTVVGEMKPVVALVENCRFDYIHNSGTNAEVKAIFLQGYTSAVRNNTFTDCFGRHIDVLGNNDTNLSKGVLQPNIIEGNKIGYTTARQAATGAGNDEPGSIYCRYADVTIIGNLLDFTNLLLSSASYVGIAVRHGYKNALVTGNTIISAKAYGILADISDQIETDQCAVSIINNNVNSIRSGRLPIAVANNSPTKTFSNVVVRDNTITYTFTTEGINLFSDPARASSFAFENVVIEGNWNLSFNSLDAVQFNAFPQSVYAPNTAITITVNPAGTNISGVITSLSDAVSRLSTYACKQLTIQLDAAVTTTQTLTGPISINLLPTTTTIVGDNGLSGRIRFYSAGTAQDSVTVANLENNQIVFNGCIFESDSGTSTTALIKAQGYGNVVCLSCNFRYGEFAIDTRGPNVSVQGGTIDDINLGSSGARSIFYVQANQLVSLMIEDTTGANNTRLYNLVTPAVLMYENISVGTTAGIKNFTLVT
jgi:hypothetical protein